MNAYELNPKQNYLEKAKWYLESWMTANPSLPNQSSRCAWDDHSTANRVINMIYFWLKNSIEKAISYLKSWMAANPSPPNQSSRCVWDDHSTANRVINIIYFWHYYKDSDIYDKAFENKLMNMLEIHGDFLADDKHYSKGNNHGIFQDRSLLELALLFPNMKNSQYWYDKAMDRLIIHVNNDVTPSGIHKEHSPSYHIIILKMIKGIHDFITQFGIEETELREKVIKMEDYLAYLAKPDGILPIMGDSSPDSVYLLDQKNIASDKLKYVISKGTQGIKPSNDAFYPDGGMTIFRNGWNINNPLYLLFTAAYHSNVHKHADDLSFLLTYGKTDFFVDSGKYNYNETNKYRQYFRTTLAHNTITVDGKSYPFTKEQVNKSRIDHYKTASYYSYVTGSHDLYKGVTIKRTVIYLKNMNSILIRDVMRSAEKHTYNETFNVGKDVQVK